MCFTQFFCEAASIHWSVVLYIFMCYCVVSAPYLFLCHMDCNYIKTLKLKYSKCVWSTRKAPNTKLCVSCNSHIAQWLVMWAHWEVKQKHAAPLLTCAASPAVERQSTYVDCLLLCGVIITSPPVVLGLIHTGGKLASPLWQHSGAINRVNNAFSKQGFAQLSSEICFAACKKRSKPIFVACAV